MTVVSLELADRSTKSKMVQIHAKSAAVAGTVSNRPVVRKACLAFSVFCAVTLVYANTVFWKREEQRGDEVVGTTTVLGSSRPLDHNDDDVERAPPFPKELLSTVYRPSDFRNDNGRAPAFWPDDPTSDTESSNRTTSSWGPCYPPDDERTRPTSWSKLDATLEYPKRRPGETSVANTCRPGFLILGAGKCGTSSLYHYLVGHPRVTPAKVKQIHYFKYYAQSPLAWYYSHFPTTRSFLASGALMTGEAAPGYLPYPDVALLVRDRMPGPRMITIAREPIDRAWSSYNYNYVREAIKRAKRTRGVVKGESNAYYQERYVFPFEDFVRTELTLLKQCLATGGAAETRAKERFGASYADAFAARAAAGAPPLVDVIEDCYPKPKRRSEPRPQWRDMVESHPEKLLVTVPNLHLVEAFLGRGLYAVQAEWWYAAHPEGDNALVCSEDMRQRPAETMNELTDFLGLPPFDYADVVAKGMYNVAGHKGYDKATSWEKANEEREEREKEVIPLSEGLRKELEDFLQAHNERLFTLAGKRCPW